MTISRFRQSGYWNVIQGESYKVEQIHQSRISWICGICIFPSYTTDVVTSYFLIYRICTEEFRIIAENTDQIFTTKISFFGAFFLLRNALFVLPVSHPKLKGKPFYRNFGITTKCRISSTVFDKGLEHMHFSSNFLHY